jgi:hypothetical protein
MPSPNDPAVTAFVNFFTPGNVNYRNVNWLGSNVFCANAGAPITRPVVGIASTAGGAGPQFAGVGPGQPINILFQQLITSFPNLHATVLPPRCYSDDQNTITLQMTLVTGAQSGRWFQPPSPYYSKPLSDIFAAGQSSSTPTCTVFTFNPVATGDNKATRLGIYMDRYQMALDLWDHIHVWPHP